MLPATVARVHAVAVASLIVAAICALAIAGHVLKTEPEHWLSMQVAMLIGLATYPMNLWLIHAGLKEKM